MDAPIAAANDTNSRANQKLNSAPDNIDKNMEPGIANVCKKIYVTIYTINTPPKLDDEYDDNWRPNDLASSSERGGKA